MRLGTSSNLFGQKRRSNDILPYREQVMRSYEAGFKVFSIGFASAFNGNGELAKDNWEEIIYDLGNEAANHGIEFSQSHAPYSSDFFLYGKQPSQETIERFNEIMRRSILASEMLGVKWVTIHPLDDNINTEFETDVIAKTNIDFFSPWFEMAKKHNVGFALENVTEFDRARIRRRFGATTDDLLAVVDTINDDAFGITWDFGHANNMIKDQCRQLRKLGKRIKATQVQDNKGVYDSHLAPFVGGTVSWESIMPCLKEIGYEGDFILECHGFMNQFPEELKLSAAKLAYDFGMYCMKLYEQA